ncbi:hypothetical protein BDR22DRAFT_481913 [Usnea florida]
MTAQNPPLESGHAQRVPSLSEPSNRVTLPQRLNPDREDCRSVERRCTGRLGGALVLGVVAGQATVPGTGRANVLRLHHIEGYFVRYRGFGPRRWTLHDGTIVPYVYAIAPFTVPEAAREIHIPDIRARTRLMLSIHHLLWCNLLYIILNMSFHFSTLIYLIRSQPTSLHYPSAFFP